MSHGHDRAECLALLERLSPYLDGDLDPAGCREVEAHMENCAPCVAFLESLRRTVALLEKDPRPTLPEDVKAAIVASFVSRSLSDAS